MQRGNIRLVLIPLKIRVDAVSSKIIRRGKDLFVKSI